MGLRKKAESVARKLLAKKRKRDEFENKLKKRYASAHRLLARNPQQPLSEADIKEIDEFWSKYGIKFRDYSWYRWYYGLTGIHDPRFIGTDVYNDIFIGHYNKTGFAEAWRDKSYFPTFLPDAPFPETYFKKCNGRYYDKDGNFCTESNFTEALSDSIPTDEFIVKLNDGLQGRGLRKFSLKNEQHIQSAIQMIAQKDNLIVQEVVRQHPFFAQFNESSVNVIRINTLFLNQRVIVFDNATLRFGLPGSITDVNFVDGVEIVNAIRISADGHLGPVVFDNFGKKTDVNTRFDIKYDRVPNWENLIETVRSCALKIPYFSWIGWDVTVSEEGAPVIIEYNILSPGINFYQYSTPLFGEYTEEVLEFLKDEKTQQKTVPPYLRK